MLSANAAMTGSYDYLQVALSVLIAISASYAALGLGERVTAASGWARSTWLTSGATAIVSRVLQQVNLKRLSIPCRRCKRNVRGLCGKPRRWRRFFYAPREMRASGI